MAATRSDWYAVRIKPGYQRMLPYGGAIKSRIEINLSKDGFHHFMPSFYTETKHHRTKEWLSKRFPMLVGYVFVNLPKMNYEELRAVDGVMCLLRTARDSAPVRFYQSDIDQLMQIENEAYSTFVQKQKLRIARESAKTRKDVMDVFPPRSTAMIVEDAPFGGMLARVIGPSSRGKIKAVIETLNGYVNVDIPLENLCKAS